MTTTDVHADVTAEKDRRIADLLAEVAALQERLRQTHVLLQQRKLLTEPGKRPWWMFWKR